MKSSFFTLLLTCIGTFMYAQNHEWAPIGAEWHYTHTYFQLPPPHPPIAPHFDYNKITCIGDTIVGGKYCKRLSFDKGNCNLWNNSYNEVFMHQDSGRIYHWNAVDSSFSLYLDFNANAGDTWEMPLWEHTFLSIPYADIAFVYVDSVTYFHIGNDSLKQLHVTYSVLDTFGQFLYVNGSGVQDIITERFGPSSQMFPVEHGYCDAEYDEGLRCYSDSSLGFHTFVPYSCDTFWYITLDTKESFVDKQDFQVSPNPIKEYVNIHAGFYKATDNFHYYLYNMTGSLLKSGKIRGIDHPLYLGDLHQQWFVAK